jgi:sensor histidine kinase regulating citrate/malate metabolism
MTHLSLRTKILLSILIPFFIALLILTISGFSVIDTGVKKIVSDQQVSIAELIASRMNDNLEKYARLLHSFFTPPHKKINELI